MNLKALAEPFAYEDIEWRAQRADVRNGNPFALVLAYVTNRAIQQRLDDVCGPENWCNRYAQGPQGGVLCGISIQIKGGWITKYDGADNTQVESVKGGLSDSMKRAAVQWGIGRYLYHLEATFAQCSLTRVENGIRATSKDKNTEFWWIPPPLPDFALPKEKTISQAQADKLRSLCGAVDDLEGKVISTLHIESLEAITEAQYERTLSRIKTSIKAAKAAEINASIAALDSAETNQEIDEIENEARASGYLEFLTESIKARRERGLKVAA